MEKIFSKLGSTDQTISQLRDDMTKKIEAITAETSSQGTNKPGVTLPQPTGLTVSSWGKLVHAKVGRLDRYKRLFTAQLEWQISTDAAFPDTSATVTIDTIRVWILHIMPTNVVHYVRVRYQGRKGQFGPWTTAVTTSGWGLIDSDAPPVPTGLTYESCVYHGWKWSRRVDVQLSVTSAPLTAILDFAGLHVRYQRADWGANFWAGHVVPLKHLYLSGGKYYFELPWVIQDQLLSVKVASFDAYQNHSDYCTAIPVTPSPIVPSVDLPGHAIIAGDTDGNYFFRAASGILYLSKTSCDASLIGKIHIQARKNTKTLYTWSERYMLDDCDVVSYDVGAGAENCYELHLERLLQGTIYDVRFKSFTYYGESHAWHAQDSAFTTGVEAVISMNGASIGASIWGRARILKNLTAWNLSITFTAPAGLAHKFQVKIARSITVLGSTQYIITNHTVDYNAEAGELVNITIPLHYAPTTEKVGENSGYYINVRAWYMAKAGTWHNTYGSPTPTGWAQCVIAAAPTGEAISAPTTTFEQIWGRWIAVKPCQDTWAYPDTFSHFDIHATHNDGSTTPDTTNNKSRIGTYHRWDRKPHSYYIPFRVWDAAAGGGSGAKAWITSIHNVKIWAVPYTWEYGSGGSANIPVPTIQSAATGGGTIASSDEEPGAPFTEDFSITKKAIAVFAGDVLYTACAKLYENISSSELSIKIAKETGDPTTGAVCPFARYDLVVLGGSGTNMGAATYDDYNHGDVKEIIYISATPTENTFSWTLTCTRHFDGKSGDTAKAGQAIAKCGVYNSTFRFMWFDATNVKLKAVKAVANTTTVIYTTEADFGSAGADGAALRINDGGDIRLAYAGALQLGSINYYNTPKAWEAFKLLAGYVNGAPGSTDYDYLMMVANKRNTANYNSTIWLGYDDFGSNDLRPDSVIVDVFSNLDLWTGQEILPSIGNDGRISILNGKTGLTTSQYSIIARAESGIIRIENNKAGLTTEAAIQLVPASGLIQLGAAAHGTFFEPDGRQFMVGTARVTKNLHLGIDLLGTGSGAPTLVHRGAFPGYRYELNKYGYMRSFEVPYEWDDTTDLEIKIHWYSPNSTAARYIRWQIDYVAIAENTDLVPTATTTVTTADITLPSGADAYKLMETTLVIPYTDVDYDDVIGIIVSRVASSGTAPASPADSPLIISLELEYIANSLGEAT
jgi:hypothetical protein